MKIHITIEPGKFTGAFIEWLGKHRRTSGGFLLLLSFVALWAAPITKPHTFTNGGTVSASEMNANFDALYTKVNSLDTRQAPILKDSAGNIFGRVLTHDYSSASSHFLIWIVTGTGYILRVNINSFSLFSPIAQIDWSGGNCTTGTPYLPASFYGATGVSNYANPAALSVHHNPGSGTARFFKHSSTTLATTSFTRTHVLNSINVCNASAATVTYVPMTEITAAEAGVPTLTPTMPFVVE